MCGDTDESGTEGETGRSHNRGTDERETENGSEASRTGGENGVVGDLGSEFFWRLYNEHFAHLGLYCP